MAEGKIEFDKLIAT